MVACAFFAISVARHAPLKPFPVSLLSRPWDPPEVAEMLRRFRSPKTPIREQNELYCSLAASGAAETVRAVLAARTPWRPLARIETRMELTKMGDDRPSRLLDRFKAPDGRTWGLVASRVLGSDGDLWLVQKVNGRWTRPLFTGVSTSAPYGLASEKAEPPLAEPAIRGKTAAELVNGAWKTTLIGLEELSRDSDHDGLTDLEETRLGTDPHRDDTDGDGVADAGDPMPNAPRRPLNEQETILAAAFEARYRGGGSSPALVNAPAGVKPFEMVGWRGPVLWRTEEKGTLSTLPLSQRFWQGVTMIGLDYMEFNESRTEAYVAINTLWGPKAGNGYTAVVRKFGPNWIVVAMSHGAEY